MHRTTVNLAVTLAFTAVATFGASAQSWEYKSYRKNAGGTYETDRFVAGTISLEEKDGQAWFTLQAGKLDVCYRGKLPATVTRTADTTLIEVTQVVPGCEQFRYTIKTDGTGGFKETIMGERGWVKSRFDHGLTPVK